MQLVPGLRGEAGVVRCVVLRHDGHSFQAVWFLSASSCSLFQMAQPAAWNSFTFASSSRTISRMRCSCTFSHLPSSHLTVGVLIRIISARCVKFLVIKNLLNRNAIIFGQPHFDVVSGDALSCFIHGQCADADSNSFSNFLSAPGTPQPDQILCNSFSQVFITTFYSHIVFSIRMINHVMCCCQHFS